MDKLLDDIAKAKAIVNNKIEAGKNPYAWQFIKQSLIDIEKKCEKEELITAEDKKNSDFAMVLTILFPTAEESNHPDCILLSELNKKIQYLDIPDLSIAQYRGIKK